MDNLIEELNKLPKDREVYVKLSDVIEVCESYLEDHRYDNFGDDL